MSAESGSDVRVLRVDGGAAANDLLCQLQADALGLTIDRSAELQTTGLGAAYLAGAGVGMLALDELATARRSDATFDPEGPATDRARWRAAVDRSRDWARGITPARP